MRLPRRIEFHIPPSYRCHLHPVRCPVVEGTRRHRCNVWTHLRPVCAFHARGGLGIELRRAGRNRMGCGLFATRTFEAGDLVCPYLGAKRSAEEWRCPHSSGTATEQGSGYAIQVDEEDGTVFQYDASCERSYGSMVNHAPSRQSNTDFVLFRGLLPSHIGERIPEEPGRCLVKHPDLPVRTGPSILLQNHGELLRNMISVGMGNRSVIWLQSTRHIDVGEEILTSYGPNARHIIRVRHQTLPSLCS